MKATITQLMVIEQARPAGPGLLRYRAIGLLTSLLALAQGIFLVRDAAEAVPLWNLALGLRVALVVAVGLWLVTATPWRAVRAAERRQGRTVAAVAMVLLVFTALLMWLDAGIYVPPFDGMFYWLLLLALLLQSIALTRLGLVTVGATLLVVQLVIHVLSISGIDTAMASTSGSLVYAMVVVCGALLVRWWAGLVLAPALPLLTALFQSLGISMGTADWLVAAVLAGNLMLIAGLTAVYGRSLERAVDRADEQAAALAESQERLAQHNRTLTAQAAELEATHLALETTVTRQESEIAAAVAALGERSIELSALQTPVIKVADDVLVAPLIGRWDQSRHEQFLDELLVQVERQRAAHVILDFTGISGMNEATVTMVHRLIQATGLLGCRCVLSGVKPEVAQLLVSLGVTAGACPTAVDLAAAISPILGQRR